MNSKEFGMCWRVCGGRGALGGCQGGPHGDLAEVTPTLGNSKFDGKPWGVFGWESDLLGLVFERIAPAAVRGTERG